jgi:nucleoside-diphosphate-sugar epimerase
VKVLVTGSAGFIGQHLCAELTRRGHEPVPFDAVLNAAGFPDGRHARDIRSAYDLHWALRNGEAGAVINLAGMLGTPELLGSERGACEVNILGAVNIYDAAAGYGGIPVVQIGTGHKGQPNPYAITKACAEDLGLARARWLGEKITVVRAYHVYGPGQLPGPPYGPAGVHKFFPTFACRALNGEPLELCGGGGQLIDPVHVSDVAAVLADAIGGPYGQVVEAGCGKPVSVKLAALDITAACGQYRPTFTAAPGRAGEPRDAEVVAEVPACRNTWPYLVPETVEWYRQWLTRS